MIPPLQPGDNPARIQVWRIAHIEKLAQQAYALLTPDERARAARMREGGVRNEFVVGRGCLRRLLSVSLHQEPQAIAFETGAHGKPRLAGNPEISFNVAHSRGLVLIAIARGPEVGVDVEYIDRSIEALDIARSSFHPADLARVEEAANQDQRIAEFYRCWTRKEAVAKADGRGLTLELTSFSTGSSGPNDQTVDLSGESAGEISRYFVRGLDAGSSHMAALASTQPIHSLILMDLCETVPS